MTGRGLQPKQVGFAAARPIEDRLCGPEIQNLGISPPSTIESTAGGFCAKAS
jgi:hypothetical protein